MSAAKRVAHAAQTIRAAWERGVTADPQTDAAQALEDTGLLMSPEKAAELAKRTELLRIVQAMARRQTKEIAGRKAFGDRLKAENAGLTVELHHAKACVRSVESLLTRRTPFSPRGQESVLLAIGWLRSELDSYRGRVDSAEAYARRTDARIRALLVEPQDLQGCALCGVSEDGHGLRVTEGFEHEWTRPTDALVRERRLMRQALERSASGAPAESELLWLRAQVAEVVATVARQAQKITELERIANAERARAAELEALKPAPMQTCGVCSAVHALGEPCGVCEFQARMAAVAGPAVDASVDRWTRLLAPSQALRVDEPETGGAS